LFVSNFAQKNIRTDLYEIFAEGQQSADEQMIKFWWRFGSPSEYRDFFPDSSVLRLLSKTSQFKTVSKDDSGYITQLKQQKSTKVIFYLESHRHIVNVLTSNITFFDFCCFSCVM